MVIIDNTIYFKKDVLFIIRTIYKSNLSDIFICYKIGFENKYYTMVKLKNKDIIHYHLEHGLCGYEDFMDSFINEGALYLIFNFNKGIDIYEYIVKYPENAFQIFHQISTIALTTKLPLGYINEVLNVEKMVIDDSDNIRFNYYLKFEENLNSIDEKAIANNIKSIILNWKKGNFTSSNTYYEFIDGLNKCPANLFELHRFLNINKDLYGKIAKEKDLAQKTVLMKNKIKVKIAKIIPIFIFSISLLLIMIIYIYIGKKPKDKADIFINTAGGMKLDSYGQLIE